MPRTCLSCSHPRRGSIDKALVAGEPLRNIEERVSISPQSLLRHKQHVSQAIVKAAGEQENKHGLNLLEEAERVRRKAWELLAKAECDGDYRGAIVGLREARECLETGQLTASRSSTKLRDAIARCRQSRPNIG